MSLRPASNKYGQDAAAGPTGHDAAAKSRLTGGGILIYHVSHVTEVILLRWRYAVISARSDAADPKGPIWRIFNVTSWLVGGYGRSREMMPL